MKRWLLRLPIHWKCMFFSGLILLSFWAAHHYFSNYLTHVLTVYFGRQHLELFEQIRFDLFRLYLLGALATVLILWIFFWDIYSYLNRMNEQLQVAVTQKKIKLVFSGRKSRDVLGSITTQSNKLLEMFRTFDRLKSARISLEVNSIKCMMNNMSEGILLLDEHKVVTHVNHRAEQLLGLVPGEVIGQVIVRHISDDLFYQALQDALDDHKVLNCEITLFEQACLVSAFPIKNRKSDILRVIVMISLKPEEPVEQGEEKKLKNTEI